ncbi:hypothetical protein [Stenotrophomonas sp. GD03657]|uniref:hypothetical protein n=1 Tax=Stenotrophomonas sp. GD03657 TaxID=2975363 RepID=UPI002447A20B|nr:hypothetical protein [Stenotrophomonas sp. GD03657]MDH2154139.1 hypothetical protein [Stenotrophomonas sp. GD03657]
MDLPEDMVTLIMDLFENAGKLDLLTVDKQLTALAQSLPLKSTYLYNFPEVAINNHPSDSRDEAYLERMAQSVKNLPPLICVDGHVVDGRHRLYCYRRRVPLNFDIEPKVVYIDLTGLIPLPLVPYVGKLKD